MKRLIKFPIYISFLLLSSMQADVREEWFRVYGAIDSREYIYDLFNADNGDILLCGENENGCLWLLRTNSNGVLQWSRFFNSNGGYSLIETDDESIIVAAYQGNHRRKDPQA